MKNLNHKQRTLLYTISKLHERGLSSRFMIIKSLFLLIHVEKIDRLIKFYNFFSYSYGPSSNVCYTDISSLQKEGYITEKEKQFELTEKGKTALKGIDPKITVKINREVLFHLLFPLQALKPFSFLVLRAFNFPYKKDACSMFSCPLEEHELMVCFEILWFRVIRQQLSPMIAVAAAASVILPAHL
jgi:hypothetical protein